MSKAKRHPLVSVIILNYNGKRFLENCLNSCLKTDYPNFEVILVDNGSTDGSFEFAKQRFANCSRLRIIRNIENLGFAEGNNVGLRVANGEYIIFLNNDTEVESAWVKELIKTMESDLTIGAAQCKLLSWYNRDKLDSAGGILTREGFGYERGQGKEDMGQFNKIEEIFFAVGAAMIVRKKLLDKIGGFEESFFMLGEDVDLSWRIWLSGHRVVFIPTSVVYHMRSVTASAATSPFHAFNAWKNRIAVLLVNYEFKNLIKNTLASIIFTTIRVVLYALNGDANKVVAYFKAVLWIILRFRRIWIRRLKIQNIRKTPDRKILEIMDNSPYLSLKRHIGGRAG